MHTNRLNQWLENSYQGKANQEILFFNPFQNHPPCNFADLKQLGNSLTSKVKLLWLDGMQEAKYRYYENQIIVMPSQEMNHFETIKKVLTRGVIYVNDNDAINKIIALLQAKMVDVNNEFSYTLLEKVEFEEVLKLDIKSLEAFILERNWLLKNIHYCFGWMELHFLGDYLAIYNYKKILLANFAHYLYRVATLDFTSTPKSIGGTIHKTLGVQSKIINLKSLKIKVATDLLKNHRIYNLNENQIELDIKISIAKKLVALDVKGLDVNKIASITELPLKNVEKIYRDCFIG